MLFDHLLRDSARLASIYEDRAPLRRVVQRFLQTFFQMTHSEGFDPRTIEFDCIVPRGEPDKVVMTLQRAEYLKEPLKENDDYQRSPSYQLVRQVRSVYAAFLAENGWLAGFVDNCPGLCNCVFALLRYAAEREYDRQQPIQGATIMCGDNIAGDLVFFVHLD